MKKRYHRPVLKYVLDFYKTILFPGSVKGKGEDRKPWHTTLVVYMKTVLKDEAVELAAVLRQGVDRVYRKDIIPNLSQLCSVHYNNKI